MEQKKLKKRRLAYKVVFRSRNERLSAMAEDLKRTPYRDWVKNIAVKYYIGATTVPKKVAADTFLFAFKYYDDAKRYCINSGFEMYRCECFDYYEDSALKGVVPVESAIRFFENPDRHPYSTKAFGVTILCKKIRLLEKISLNKTKGQQ